jgi:hypothetical protein
MNQNNFKCSFLEKNFPKKEHLKIISTVDNLLNGHRLTCVIYLLRNTVKGKI